mmetsp:Transcript_23942/g.75286  ORF Transcript_23942/g.75286 Transcript_23942/m.75286 type:complete len:369 (-) Transcript_23942:51-1157(-)
MSVHVDKGLTGEALKDINTAFDEALTPLLYSLGGTIMGVLGILQWHLLPLKLRSSIIRNFGRSMIVLQIYNDQRMHELLPFIVGKPFVVSCFAILMERVGMWWVLRESKRVGEFFSGVHQSVADMVEGSLQTHAKGWFEQAYGPYEEEDDPPFKNVYMYLARPFRRATYFFIAQSGLMAYYVYNLNADPDTHDPTKVSVVKWFFAVIITAIAGDDETGSDYEHLFWTKILRPKEPSSFWEIPQGDDRKIIPAHLRHKVFVIIPIRYQKEWWLRSCMDWLVNSVFRTTLMGTAPIMLCVEEPLDFIKDCLAIFFIAKLDDYDEAKTFKEFKEEADHYEMPELLQNRLFWGLKRDADDRDWSRTSLLEQD